MCYLNHHLQYLNLSDTKSPRSITWLFYGYGNTSPLYEVMLKNRYYTKFHHQLLTYDYVITYNCIAYLILSMEFMCYMACQFHLNVVHGSVCACDCTIYTLLGLILPLKVYVFIYHDFSIPDTPQKFYTRVMSHTRPLACYSEKYGVQPKTSPFPSRHLILVN